MSLAAKVHGAVLASLILAAVVWPAAICDSSYLSALLSTPTRQHQRLLHGCCPSFMLFKKNLINVSIFYLNYLIWERNLSWKSDSSLQNSFPNVVHNEVLFFMCQKAIEGKVPPWNLRQILKQKFNKGIALKVNCSIGCINRIFLFEPLTIYLKLMLEILSW